MQSARRWLIIGGVALMFAVGLWFLAGRVFAAQGSRAGIQSAVVSRGDIEASVLSSGALQPAADLSLTFGTAGTLSTLQVKQGDHVTKGQPVAALDTGDLALGVTQAQANLTSAQAKLEQLKVGPTASDVAAAQAQLASAQAKLEQLKAGSTAPQDIANARAAVKSAQAKLDSVKAGSTQLDIANARSTLASAQAKLAQLKVGPTASDLAAAQAQLTSAQAKLDQLKAGATASDLAAAQANLGAAQAKLSALKDGPTEAQLSAAQLKVSSAQANLDKTRSSASLNKQQAELAFNQADHALRNAQDKYNTTAGPLLNPDGTLKDGLTQAQVDNYNTTLRALQDAEDNYAKAQIALDDARTQEVTSVQSAQAQLDDANKQLADLTAGATPADLASAEAAVVQAQNSLDKLKAPPTAADMAAAQAAVVQAQNSLDKLKAPPTAADMAAAQAAVDQAQNNLNKLLAGPVQTDVIQAQAAVDQAQNNLNKLLAPPTAADTAAAQAAVVQAQNSLDKLKAPATTADMAAAQAAVAQAQANLQSAQLKLQQATITAPFDGVIVNVPLFAGQQVSANTEVAELVNDASYHVDMNVGEADISRVKTGQPVDLTFDALPDEVFTGTVTYVSPQAEVQQGVVSYLATVTIDPKAAGPNSPLRPGMTTTAAAIVDRASNVLIVPNRAVRTEGRQKVVYLVGPNQSQIRVPVQTGISDDTNTEIVGDTPLREGDAVVIPAASTSTTQNANRAGGGIINFGGAARGGR